LLTVLLSILIKSIWNEVEEDEIQIVEREVVVDLLQIGTLVDLPARRLQIKPQLQLPVNLKRLQVPRMLKKKQPPKRAQMKVKK
jgi:hypothetical protein